MALTTRTATGNGEGFGALKNAALACGIAVGNLNEPDAIALAVANVLDTMTQPGQGLGYLPGSGGTVNQSSSKSTGVTLNTVTGQITLNNASLASATAVSFTVTNSAVQANDIIVAAHISGGTGGGYLVGANTPSAGTSFKITVYNVSGGALAEAIVVGYAILRGATA